MIRPEATVRASEKNDNSSNRKTISKKTITVATATENPIAEKATSRTIAVKATAKQKQQRQQKR